MTEHEELCVRTRPHSSDDADDYSGAIEQIFASVSVGDTTPEYWYSVLDRSIAEAQAKGDATAVSEARDLQRELRALFCDEARFVAVSRSIAHSRLRQHCRVIIPRGRRRARGSHRRVGGRTTAKATATGDPADPEPPGRRPRLIWEARPC